MRQPYIAGNWKMHKTIAETLSTIMALRKDLDKSGHKVMIAPPFTSLQAAAEALKGSSILLGAQNMAAEEQGAHTGEISVLMLKDAGAGVVILGHSERRSLYKEEDSLINKKVLLALKHALPVILCVGETLTQREQGQVEKVVGEQVEKGLAQVGAENLKMVTIAYEPVWAIGTGKNATPEDADAVHAFIRGLVGKLYSKQAAEDLIIQYGGSVKPDNVKALMSMPNIDGALVGGASLKPETFVPIVEFNK
ncbi:MAG: triose-phosphate isomerase [Spirochaetales bacterium]|nr:MAG: triose-phosphate isomerase [Spirochaetales bacterium]